MIEKLQIRGFGVNEKLDVEFSPNVTSIVGKSYIGKSWMLRSLRWVMRNKPAGDSFINWDSDEAKVRLSIDSKRITRIRSNNNNSYRLSGKAKSFVAFGNDVPRDIAELVNISEINFQGQHSSPFWFCETAGEVSRQLNSIVNLEVIDSTLANIAGWLRDTNTVIKLTEKSLLEANKEKKELSYIEEMDVELKQVEYLFVSWKAKTEKRSIIEEKLNLVAKYASIQEKRLGLVSEGAIVLSVAMKYEKLSVSVENLSKLIESAQNLKDVLENRPPSIRPLEKLKKRTEQLSIQYDRLDSLIESIEIVRKVKCKVEKELERCKKELKEIAGGRCPLCGMKLKS